VLAVVIRENCRYREAEWRWEESERTETETLTRGIKGIVVSKGGVVTKPLPDDQIFI
jgi:hypothetical protein